MISFSMWNTSRWRKNILKSHHWGDETSRLNFKRVILTTLLFGLIPSTLNAAERVSISSEGIEGNGGSIGGLSVSETGRFVVFRSRASNLVADDTNDAYDLFLHDRASATTERISVNSSGMEAMPGDRNVGRDPTITSDGSLVAFGSASSELAGESGPHIYLRNRTTDTTELVSVSSTGAPQAFSYGPRISANGRYIAFSSVSADVVPGDRNESNDVFVRDLILGITERISVNSLGVEGNNHSGGEFGEGIRIPAISSDGRYVAFISIASNLGNNDENGQQDVFVRDRVLGITERVSVSSRGIEGNADSGGDSFAEHLEISSDGQFVIFSSFASNLVEGDTNNSSDIFIRDRINRTTERISLDSFGNEGDGNSVYPRISSNAQRIVFRSTSSNLDSVKNGGVYIHDKISGFTEHVADSSTTISLDGEIIAFTSSDDSIVENDSNGHSDVFVKPVNFSPTITSSPAVTLLENTTTITMLTATDLEGDTITFEIFGGTDQALVTVNASTGEFSFISAPDFESPADANGDNIYEVQVRARDAAGGTGVQSFQDLRITVENTVEPCVSLVLGRWATIGGDCRTRGVVEIGNFSRVGNNADLGDGTVVGGYARIGNDFTTGSNVQVGSFSHIGDRVSIGSNSTLGRYLRIGNDVVIGERSNIDQFSRISNNVEIGNDVVINRNVVIGDNVNVRDNTHIDQFARIGANSVIENNVEIGRNVRIGQGSTIGANTRIERFANIGNNVRIGSNVTIGQYARIPNNAVVPDGSLIGAFETFRP